jgi:hypothetical protein
MAISPILHEKVRENREPRITATALAKYLILRPEEQDKVLHDSRFSRQPVSAKNAEAYRALRAYNCDPRRPLSTLDKVKKALLEKAAAADVRPKSRDEAMRCKEVIELFELRENALGTRSMSLREPPRFAPIDVEGVTVSIQPSFLRDGTIEDRPHIGAGILRLAKAPDPDACKMDETRARRGDHRREMGRYLVAMLHMLLTEQKGAYGKHHPDLCFVADVRLGELIGPSDIGARMRSIRAACAQIERLWDSVEPKPWVLKKPT